MHRVLRIPVLFIYLALIFCSLSCKTINKNSGPAVEKNKEKLPPCVEKQNIYEKQILSQQEKDNLGKNIVIFTKEIEGKPQYFGAYYNRAISYYFDQEYDLSWQDVYRAQALGGKFKPEFIEALRKASGRDK